MRGMGWKEKLVRNVDFSMEWGPGQGQLERDIWMTKFDKRSAVFKTHLGFVTFEHDIKDFILSFLHRLRVSQKTNLQRPDPP